MHELLCSTLSGLELALHKLHDRQLSLVFLHL